MIAFGECGHEVFVDKDFNGLCPTCTNLKLSPVQRVNVYLFTYLSGDTPKFHTSIQFEEYANVCKVCAKRLGSHLHFRDGYLCCKDQASLRLRHQPLDIVMAAAIRVAAKLGLPVPDSK